VELVKAKHLDRYEKKVMAGLALGAKGFLEMGEGLFQIHEGNLWLEAGSKSFENYIDGHLPISRSTAYNAIKFYQVCKQPMLDDPSLAVIEPTRVIKLLPHMTPENTMELLHSAATMPNAKSFDNYLRSLQKKVCTDECDHPEGFSPMWEYCKICNQKRRVKEVL
jgi:hypothetical protein